MTRALGPVRLCLAERALLVPPGAAAAERDRDADRVASRAPRQGMQQRVNREEAGESRAHQKSFGA